MDLARSKAEHDLGRTRKAPDGGFAQPLPIALPTKEMGSTQRGLLEDSEFRALDLHEGTLPVS
jgi:hypothetical protein